MKGLVLGLMLILGLGLGGCATATRGSNTNFVVSTTPPGARVMTSVPVRGFVRLSQREVARIKAGKKPVPHYTYRFCEPTPCGIKMPRKAEFIALISKDGHIPRMVKIRSLTNKEINRELAGKTMATAGVTAAAGAGMAVAMSSGISGAAIGGGALVGGMAIIAAPIVGVGLLIHGVDSANGANRDLWPNPIAVTLPKVEDRPFGEAMAKAISTTFEQERVQQALIPRKTYAQIQAEHQARLERSKRKSSRSRKPRGKVLADSGKLPANLGGDQP